MPLLLALVGSALGCDSRVAVLGTLARGIAGETGLWTGGAGGFGADDRGNAGRAGGMPWSFLPSKAVDALAVTGAVTTDPSAPENGLELYMMSTRDGDKDIWVSRRTSTSIDWSLPVEVSELNSAASESNCKVSADGLTIWFHSDRDRSVGTFWESSRESMADRWGTPTVIPGLYTDGASDIAVATNATRTVAILSSERQSGTAGYDLFEARRASPNVAFDKPISIAEVNSAGDDFDPYLSPDGKLLVFHSSKSGSDDIYWTTRTDIESPFAPPSPLLDINSGADDAAPAMSVGLRMLWFASTRDGDERIYEAYAPGG